VFVTNNAAGTLRIPSVIEIAWKLLRKQKTGLLDCDLCAAAVVASKGGSATAIANLQLSITSVETD